MYIIKGGEFEIYRTRMIVKKAANDGGQERSETKDPVLAEACSPKAGSQKRRDAATAGETFPSGRSTS